MKEKYHYITNVLVVGFLLLTSVFIANAQNITTASGIVRDSVTGEPLSYVSVLFEKSTIGAMTDDFGKFFLQNDKGLTRLVVSSLGYNAKTITLKAGQKNENIDIPIRPSSYELAEVLIRPTRERYSKKNNPAVDLIRQVIEHKNDNRIEARDEYEVEVYEKLAMSLDNFNPDFEKNKFWNKLKFIKNYMDTSELNGKPILTLSIRESLSDFYYRKSPKTQKTIVKAKQTQGIDQTVDEGGITSNLEEIFQSINIFDNNIKILLNSFVSPLSSLLATSYYKYYIMDTVEVSGDPCVDLAFVPVNSQGYGFTGRLYITLDGKYSIKKFRLNTPQNINLNFVNNLNIEQEFKRMPDSTWVVDTENTYLNFYLIDGAQQLYAHQLRVYSGYKFEVEKGDSIFNLLGSVHVREEAEERPDSFWVNNRHVPLSQKEDVLDDLLDELRKIPAFNVIIKTAEILISGYIQTGPKRELNYLDIGPMNTVFSANHLEGFRIRVGGMTTAYLHPHLFASGYLAYGMDDRKFKYNGKLTYSFDKKKYHEGEVPVNNLSFIQEYDVYTPGQDFLFTSKDNMFVAWKVGKPVTNMNYVSRSLLQYEKEWLNGLMVKTWARRQSEEAAGTLQYLQRDEEGNTHRLKNIISSEIGAQLRFAPGERSYGGRKGKESLFNVSKDAPIFKLSHQMGIKGVLGSGYDYHHTEFSAEKRIWLSSFGHIDAKIKAGKVWNQAPFPLLILPNTNQSVTIQPEAFHLMRAMEFVADQYVSINATYYLKGWILNRIPLIRWLKFREVVSFNGIYGNLSNRNNPALGHNNLFLLPEGTTGLGDKPYMEVSFGLENIFKILRIDYYRRLTYLDHPNIQKNGIRIALHFSF
ncbi:MAG: DUF5686 and carboxypeptidase regulatory-like domain-containing protein [Tannerellaceae bacterium]|jgi:hypothetical protein|nr:DUF5686 and carboxypeptidase regulatory-like domain-containing protein [Tannerellaceae bacterium]